MAPYCYQIDECILSREAILCVKNHKCSIFSRLKQVAVYYYVIVFKRCLTSKENFEPAL